MKLHKLMGNQGYTTWGCMWEKGVCTEQTGYSCRNEKGEEVPMQVRTTAYWPDGSVKWTAHTADASLLGNGMTVEPADRTSEPADRKSKSADKTSEPVTGMSVKEEKDFIEIDNGILKLSVPKQGKYLFTTITRAGKVIAENARPELILSEPVQINGSSATLCKEYEGAIECVELEEVGPLLTGIKFLGTHVNREGDKKISFVIRLKIFFNSAELKFMHTFLYDGDPDKDYLKGLGIAFEVLMSGEQYNRHLKFTPDYGTFHESCVTLVSWRPRVPEGLHKRQMEGECLVPKGRELEDMNRIMKDIPFWDTYDICQDSDSHFMIRKKLSGDHLCYIDSLHGNRAKGGLSIGSENGSVMVAMRDFWEKYPSGYTVSGLTKEKATCQIWLWSPTAREMDFRHYADRGYNQVCYEGYDYKGADPYGIACTNEFNLLFSEKLIAQDKELLAFAADCNTTTLYVADPKEYHALRAFGYWSLPKQETDLQRKLEEDMEKGFLFYEREVEQRKWYGMFHYGDFMHTYDSDRHVWRYDVGGYAWDNTELVPTLWLWYYFMRTGREDVFRLAEKMTRHTSEVDVYHMGKYKGMGSRHNVIHWGCPCKEARIAMAGHHRFYYYLTGDRRLEDIFDELKDNEETFLNKDPIGDFYDRSSMVEPSHARTGPDWSSLCSNWLTQWERKKDTAYRDKILVGSEDIKKAPLKLISGPDFEFNPHSLHLRYIGERTTGGTHLQICMGAPSIWMEMADLLEDEEWKDMLAEYGRFYFLPDEDRQKESNGLIGERQFSIPMFATGIGAYGARRLGDSLLKERVIKTLLDSQYRHFPEGFTPQTLLHQGNTRELSEISWISTNHVAQFCLNAIMMMEFIEI